MIAGGIAVVLMATTFGVVPALSFSALHTPQIPSANSQTDVTTVRVNSATTAHLSTPAFTAELLPALQVPVYSSSRR